MENIRHPDARSVALHAKLLRVLEDVTTRRLRGETLVDDEVMAAHPDLMPDLGSKLEALSRAERARRRMEEETVAVQATGGDAWSGRESASPVLAADAFPGYELLEEIGRGAMGVVYRALQTATQREVAIKVMVEGPFAGPHDRARFEREAHLLGRLRHPNIVTIHDTITAAGRFCIVMDYIPGCSLDEYDIKRKLPLRERLALFAGICDAVSAAHVRGIVHRDLKPGNIRLDDAGTPHVLDFGLAKSAAGDEGRELMAHSMTMTGQFIGSLPWASPEQAEGDSDGIDLRTDVYALGVMLYQLLTRRFPYNVVGNIRQVVDNILQAQPQRPSILAADVDDDVETIVLKCLSKDRERRYQSAVELARDLRHYLSGEPIEAKRDSSWYVLGKALRRHRAGVLVASTFLVLLIAFGVTMSVLYRRAENEAARTRRTVAFLQDTFFEASSQRLGADVTLLAVLDDAAARIATEFTDQPTAAAAVHFTLGRTYESLWRPDDALHHLRQAVDLFTASLGREHPDTVEAMVLYGMVLAEMRRPQSVDIQEEALAIRRRQYGDDHVLVAESMSELAFTFYTAAVPRRWEEAANLYERALAIYRRNLGPEHVDIARCLHTVAILNHVYGRREKAVSIYAESLAMSRKLLGDSHQFVAECMSDYAVALQAVGREDEAEALLRQVVEHSSDHFGHAAKPKMLLRMAEFYRGRGDLAEARRWLDLSLAAKLDYAADRDQGQRDRLRAMAARFDDVSREMDPALYLEALAALQKVDRNRGDLASLQTAFAEWFKEAGDVGTAEQLVRDAEAVLADSPLAEGLFHHYLRSMRGRWAAEQGRTKEAESLLRPATAALVKIVGPGHHVAREVIDVLAELYDRTGQPERAADVRATYHQQ